MHERDPADAFCTYAIALEHAKAGRHREALEWFSKSAVADPSAAYTHYHWARSLEALSRDEDAAARAREGLREAMAGGDTHAAAELRTLLDSWGAVA